MFRRKDARPASTAPPVPAERVTSVLGTGTIWKGSLSGSGGVRIEGAFEGEIALRGLLVVGATGRVTCPHLRASAVIIAGAVRGDITAERVEIRSTGRVWGNVVAAAFSTEEGAFLRGQIQMEEKVDIGVVLPEKLPAERIEEAEPAGASAEEVEEAQPAPAAEQAALETQAEPAQPEQVQEEKE
jgi:cytoskeletal protein CcmA (bactofilin family)